MAQDSGAGLRNGARKKPKRGTGYPRRTPFFFHRFVRWLIKTCAAMVIGADGCWLLAVIAATEDSARYRYAVRFFNQQLAQLCGWSIDKLDRVRRRCIDEGFLHYEAGGNRTPGLYWVLVDGSLEDAPELGPIGELDSDFKPQVAEHPAEDSTTEPLGSCGETPEESAELTSLLLSNTSPPPPPVAPNVEPSKPEPVGEADRWDEVEEGLISSGVSHWRGLLSSFRQTGCSAEHALELIAFWKLNQDRFDSPVGALHHRFENAHPSIPADERWPGLQAKPKPKPAPEVEIGRYTAAWSLLRPSRRAELARQAQIDLSGHEGKGLRELPPALQKPIIEILARGTKQKPSPGRED
ncbi:MAG: hypothetical protein ISQ06_14125 [Planctomycetaceae bacterium]|nr:hypothetical protein [Planctomycetaceae bacterium]